MKVKCAVVEDLLPLYIDEVCSEASREIVEEHLSECGECRAKLKTLKGDLVVGDEVIKENLKSKDPFKKIKRSALLKFTSIVMVIIVLFLAIPEIGGDGFGFSALYGRLKSERVLNLIEKGKFQKATNYMSFSGGIYRQIKFEEAARIEWTSGMLRLKDEGIEIISHSNNRIITDDTFTSGYVDISVRYENKVYNFNLFISTNTGKVELGNVSPIMSHELPELSETEKMLIERISRVISTYFPG